MTLASDTAQRENKTDKEKNQLTTLAGKEDDADSTVTKTTTAFTSVCESEQDNYTTEGLVETTTLYDQTNVFGNKKIGEPCPQAENAHIPRFQKKKKQSPSTLNKAGHCQA